MSWQQPQSFHQPRKTYKVNRPYASWKWIKFSRTLRQQVEWSLCVDCGRVSEELHHKVRIADAPHLQYELSNLVPICKRCHAKRTSRGE